MNTTGAIESLAQESADRFAERFREETGSLPSEAERMTYKLGFVAGLSEASREFRRELEKHDNG